MSSEFVSIDRSNGRSNGRVNGRSTQESLTFRQKFGEIPVVTASMQLLFSFLTNHLVWISKQDVEEFKDITGWASDVLEDEHGIAYHRNSITDQLYNVDSASATAYIVGRKMMYNEHTNEDAIVVSWWTGKHFIREEIPTDAVQLKDSNPKDLTDEICFRFEEVIDRINKARRQHECDQAVHDQFTETLDYMNTLYNQVSDKTERIYDLIDEVHRIKNEKPITSNYSGYFGQRTIRTVAKKGPFFKTPESTEKTIVPVAPKKQVVVSTIRSEKTNVARKLEFPEESISSKAIVEYRKIEPTISFATIASSNSQIESESDSKIVTVVVDDETETVIDEEAETVIDEEAETVVDDSIVQTEQKINQGTSKKQKKKAQKKKNSLGKTKNVSNKVPTEALELVPDTSDVVAKPKAIEVSSCEVPVRKAHSIPSEATKDEKIPTSPLGLVKATRVKFVNGEEIKEIVLISRKDFDAIPCDTVCDENSQSSPSALVKTTRMKFVNGEAIKEIVLMSRQDIDAIEYA